MRIAEASAKSGITIDPLRFYEKEGLITPERSSNQRVYSDADLEQLEVISRLRRLGISIPDIRRLLEIDSQVGNLETLSEHEHENLQQVRSMLDNHIDRIETQIQDLQSTLASFQKMTSKLTKLLDPGGLGDGS